MKTLKKLGYALQRWDQCEKLKKIEKSRDVFYKAIQEAQRHLGRFKGNQVFVRSSANQRRRFFNVRNTDSSVSANQNRLSLSRIPCIGPLNS